MNPIAGEYYNIGGTYTCSIGEMLDKLLSFSSVKSIKVETDINRIRPIDADLQVPNIEKFSNHTGWKPKINFEKTMEDLLNYWREKVNSGQIFLSR